MPRLLEWLGLTVPPTPLAIAEEVMEQAFDSQPQSIRLPPRLPPGAPARR
jgi:hypothetical protein